MAADKEFVHLHVHTDYSLLDGCSRIDRLCQRADELGMKALAITDHGVLFGLASFFKQAQKAGVKPLLGCEIYLVYEDKLGANNEENAKQKRYHMGLLARNFKGYQNLTKLVSKGHVEGFYRNPRVSMTDLAEHAEGLIGFSGCLAAVIPQMLMAGRYEEAREACGRFVDIFGKEFFFIEIMDHGLKEQRDIIPDLLKIATEFGLKVVATNDVHYVKHSDHMPHDALLCIQTGAHLKDEKRLRYESNQFYLKSRQEMEQVFGERPDSITNTSAVAEMCDVKLPFNENHYPVFEQPVDLSYNRDEVNFERMLDIYVAKKNELLTRDGKELIELSPGERAELRKNGLYLFELCKQGLKERYGVDYDEVRKGKGKEEGDESGTDAAGGPSPEQLCDQLDYELAIITGTGFVDYFLIVWDFIKWARDRDIPVGPGRGSGAGCMVAFVLKITDIDPFRFGLLFERMLNLERVSPPDFDVDFCMRRRDEVVNFVREKYGHDRVANIITFGTFGAKMIVRDLARINDLSFQDGDRLAKMIPDELNISLDAAVEKSIELKQELKQNEAARQIVDHGKVIEGMVRNTGKHACGIIIADQPITNLIPVTLQEGDLTTQYPKGPSEDLGLLKMDFLGLKTLTVIADAQENVRVIRGLKDFNIEDVSLDDPATFKLLGDAKTVGVFQLESGGMQSLCRQLEVNSIEEIVALIALYRPGPMQFIPQYIKGKKDPATIDVPHPLLKELVEETYGVLVYQEQVMKSAQIIAGYTLGDADILRRAMGKKIKAVMDAQKQVFVQGAKTANNISRSEAERIFGILEKFAQYGFNKSHSAAYAMLSYRTAYLKANYPCEFMAALLSSELGNADKVSHFIAEAESLSIEVLGPDINESRERFTPVLSADNGAGAQAGGRIRFGLAAIKGVGDAAAVVILGERDNAGPYADFYDFAKRVDIKAVNKRVCECLIKTGAFDFAGADRGALLDDMDRAINEVAALQKDKEAGQFNMFDALDGGADDAGTQAAGDGPNRNARAYTSGIAMDLTAKLNFEKELLGFYVSGHPMNAFAGFDKGLDTLRGPLTTDLEDRTPFRLCGVVSGLTKKISRKDNRPWSIITISTRKDSYTMNMYAETYEKHGAQLEVGKCFTFEGTVFNRDDDVRLSVDSAFALDEAVPRLTTRLTWVVRVNGHSEAFLAELEKILHARSGGDTEIRIGFLVNDGELLVSETAKSLNWRLDLEACNALKRHPACAGFYIHAPAPERKKRRWEQ